jgi:hypothetical protein
MIRERDPGPYDDRVGPVVVVGVLCKYLLSCYFLLTLLICGLCDLGVAVIINCYLK